MRDSETHQGVIASISVDGPESAQLQTNEFGAATRALATGEYRLEISAQGYDSLRTHTFVDASGFSRFSVFLVRLTPTPEHLPEVLRTRLRPGYTLVEGYAVDSWTRKPLQGVRVNLQKARAGATTDERGYYYISVPTPPALGEVPGTETLTAELKGYKSIIHRNFVLTGEKTGFNLDMARGIGVEDHDDTHKLMRPDDSSGAATPDRPSNKISPELYQWLGTRSQSLAVGSIPDSEASAAVIVPSTIRVGINCPTKSTCTDVVTHALEEYVQLGLQSEWYPSCWVLLFAGLQSLAGDQPPSRAGCTSKTQQQGKSSSTILGFRVIRPQFVVYGRNLSSVEIWYTPSGTEQAPSRVGMARRITGTGRRETWVLAIPPYLLGTEVFAIGYDKAHAEVGRQSLPYKGATELYKALYGP